MRRNALFQLKFRTIIVARSKNRIGKESPRCTPPPQRGYALGGSRELNAKSRSLFLDSGCFEFAPQQSRKKKSSARGDFAREREDANKGHCVCVRVYLTIFGHQQHRRRGCCRRRRCCWRVLEAAGIILFAERLVIFLSRPLRQKFGSWAEI
jgi:hypothetical protein